MATSNELYDFIKTLTSNEKRYFRLQTSLQTGKKNYSKLFEELDALEEYDIDLLKERLKDSSFSKSLHVTSNYLYQRLLESLRSYHEESSIIATLNNLLLDAEILKKKGFYKMAMDILQKAAKLAAKHHKYFILHEIFPMKIEIIVASADKNLFEQLEEIQQDAQATNDKMTEESRFTYLHYWFILVFRKWRYPKDKNIIDQMEQYYNWVINLPYP